MRIAVCLLTACTAWLSVSAHGQPVLALGGGATAPGGSVSLPLSITNGGAAAAAVQWSLLFSPTDFSAGNITAGPVTSSLNKTLTCDSPSVGRFDCIVSGLNANALTDGVLAFVNLTTASTLSGSPTINVTNSLVASPGAQPVSVNATGAVVSVGPTVTAGSCSPSTIVAPDSSSCTVTLSGAAPAGGAIITLAYGPTTGVTGSAPPSITVPAGAGTGTFTAGITQAAADSIVPIAASLNGSSISFSLRVLVVTVTVNPPTATLNSLQTQQFTAAVTNTTNTAVTWSLNPNVGSISSSGVYTPPILILSRQTVTVTATSAADPTKHGTATVTLVPLLGL